eukprot:6491768-Amphidinium_carterae.2
MASTPATKRKALTAAWAADTTVKTKVRKFADRSIEEQVERCIRDHCKGWTDHQLNCIVVDGKTAVEHIREAKTAHRNGESRDTGKLFWQWLTASFVGRENEASDALALQENEEPSDELMQLFAELLKSDPDRGLLSSYCKRQTDANAVDMRVLGQAVMMLNPMGSGDQHAVGMEVLRLLQRSKVEESPGMMAALMEKSDAFLKKFKESLGDIHLSPETWRRFERSSTDPVEFLQLHSDVVYCVLERNLVKSVLELTEGETFEKVKAELRALWGSSRLGKLVFAAPVRRLVHDELESLIDQAVGRLKTAQHVTQAVLTKTYGELNSSIAAKEEMTLLDGCRYVTLTYNAIDFTMMSRSPAKTAEMHIEVAVREAATLAGTLPYLPGEKLLHAGEKEAPFQVDAGLVEKCKKARAHITKIINDTVGKDGMSGERIQADD